MNQSIARFLYYLGIAHTLRYYKHRNKLVTILCLHRISDEYSPCFPALTIKNFERLLQYINKRYQVINIASIGTFTGSKPALILSFDDGYTDFLVNALPRLKHYGFAANLNVVTKCLDNNFQIWTERKNNLLKEIALHKHRCTISLDKEDVLEITAFDDKSIFNYGLQLFTFLFTKDEAYVENFITELQNSLPFSILPTPMLSWSDLQYALENFDIELGSHSVSHITLSNIGDSIRLQKEILDSKKNIEERTGRTIDIFALPNGNYNHGVINQCKSAGYKHILTVDEKLVPTKQYNDFILPRVLVAYTGFHENILKTENFHNVAKGIIAKIKK